MDNLKAGLLEMGPPPAPVTATAKLPPPEPAPDEPPEEEMNTEPATMFPILCLVYSVFYVYRF